MVRLLHHVVTYISVYRLLFMHAPSLLGSYTLYTSRCIPSTVHIWLILQTGISRLMNGLQIWWVYLINYPQHGYSTGFPFWAHFTMVQCHFNKEYLQVGLYRSNLACTHIRSNGPPSPARKFADGDIVSFSIVGNGDVASIASPHTPETMVILWRSRHKLWVIMCRCLDDLNFNKRR